LSVTRVRGREEGKKREGGGTGLVALSQMMNGILLAAPQGAALLLLGSGRRIGLGRVGGGRLSLRLFDLHDYLLRRRGWLGWFLLLLVFLSLRFRFLRSGRCLSLHVRLRKVLRVFVLGALLRYLRVRLLPIVGSGVGTREDHHNLIHLRSLRLLLR
ncbi:hypothetical protein PMAYCL1PPCAC_24589, partial [Pristionchus mayeri]